MNREYKCGCKFNMKISEYYVNEGRIIGWMYFCNKHKKEMNTLHKNAENIVIRE